MISSPTEVSLYLGRDVVGAVPYGECANWRTHAVSPYGSWFVFWAGRRRRRPLRSWIVIVCENVAVWVVQILICRGDKSK